MKILQGKLKEVLYDYPDQELVDSGCPAPPNPKRSTVLGENEVSYITSKFALASTLSSLRSKIVRHIRTTQNGQPRHTKSGCISTFVYSTSESVPCL
jgi:hypothetical protein